MSRRARLFWIVLLATGCGRSPLQVDAGSDLRPPDQSPPGEGVRPCAPSCNEICTLRKNCALLPKAGFDACVQACEVAPSLPTNLCLGQIVCRGGPGSCKDVEICVTNPTLPDLVASLSASSPASGQLAFSARVCNQGSGSAASSALHLYLNRVKAPALQEPGDRVIKIAPLAPGACVEHSSVESVSGGTYWSWLQIDAENGILEEQESNNLAGPEVTSVGGAALPDLTVTSLTASASGGTASYLARVCNIGSVSAGATKLDIYANRSTPPTVGLAGDASVSVASLAGGSCQQLTVTVKLPGSGPLSSWALVDRPGLILEHSESNNAFGPISILVEPLPDLVITSAYGTGSGGTSVSFNATVCNQGKAPSGPVELAFYPNRSAAPDASALPTWSKTIGGLPVGSCAIESWYHGYPSAGVYNAWFWVDRLGVEPETDEKNLFGPVKVVVGGGLPDLTVSLSASAASGGIVSYTATVCNKGIGPSSPASLDLYYHSPSQPPAFLDGDQTTAVPPINPGDCAPIKLVASLATGTYQSRAWVDRGNLVQETSEGNNLTTPLTVSVNAGNGPDLVVSSFTTFVNASFVYYYLTVCNAGTGYSSVGAVEIYYDRATAPTAATVGDQSKPVISLGVGGCTTFTFVTTLPTGSYHAWAFVDRADTTKETNETNNLKGPVTVNVSSGQGVDLTVASMTFDTLTGLYQVTVCNKGGAASWSSYVDLYYNRPSAPKTSDWGDASLPVASIPGGGCTTLSHAAKLAAGSHSSWAFVDRYAQVPETNETNNVYGPLAILIGMTKPDLVVDKLTAQVGASGSVSYSITVCNTGNLVSSSCYLSLYYDLASPPTSASKADGSIFMGSILPGACSGGFTWNGKLGAGSHSSWAWVDSTGMVSEVNEANNLAGPIQVVVGPADSCQTICEALVSPCGLLPQVQLGSCMSSCQGRSQTKINCALQALSQGKCLEIVSCLFS